MNQVFNYKLSSYIDELTFQEEVKSVLSGLLRERKSIMHFNKEDLGGQLAEIYKVGRDTFVPYGDLGKRLDKFTMHGILVLMVETTPKEVTITIPYKEPEYQRSIGLEGSKEYIPSTTSFINSFNPQSGYRGPLGKTGKYKDGR